MPLSLFRCLEEALFDECLEPLLEADPLGPLILVDLLPLPPPVATAVDRLLLGLLLWPEASGSLLSEKTEPVLVCVP